ncbi:hypothetical protein ZWY2020_028905 [Hordeum vulgare]|nr:hypothetical protein ZWY2020_028905 [Hordeum vulgare]
MDAAVGLRPRPRAWARRRETQVFPPVIVPAARLAVTADQSPARRPLVLRSDAGRRSADPICSAARMKGVCCQKSARFRKHYRHLQSCSTSSSPVSRHSGPATRHSVKYYFQFTIVMREVIAGCLSEEEIKGLKEMFKDIDKDNSGTIMLEELKNELAKQGTKLSDNEIEQLMEAADADVNGLIDYEEFVTATVHMNKMDGEEHLYTTFQFYDKDCSGYIKKDELEQALKENRMYDAKEIKEIISEVDTVKRAILIPVLEGRDLIARAKTRTEKTLA